MPKTIFILYHSHKKRKDRLEGSLDQILLAAELEFPKILGPRLPQQTSNVNNEYARRSEWFSLHVNSFWSTDTSQFYYSDINLFLIYDACCKLCNAWLLLCQNNSRSITILELNIGRKYCCSYYSRQVITYWQFEKFN